MTDPSNYWRWSHNLKDYEVLFALTEVDKKSKILDCAAGAGCFTAQLREQGGQVIACDPLYREPLGVIEKRVEAMRRGLLERIGLQMEKEPVDPSFLLWELEKEQKKNAAIFLKDYEHGIQREYYQPYGLLDLPFKYHEFDLALCANFLFDGGCLTSSMAHLEAVKALLRVAKEVRIFPLVDEKGEFSKDLGEVMSVLQKENCGMEICETHYTVQKKPNALLRVWSQTCSIEVR